MTVGQALARLTGLRLLHNHMSIELVHPFFDFGTPEFRRLDKTIRFGIFQEVAQSDLPGLIFTFVWAYNEAEDEQYIAEIEEIFEAVQADIFFVELRAEQTVRLQRNKHPHRLEHKPTKRDLARAEKSLLSVDEKFRTQSKPAEHPDRNFLYIDNTHLSAEATAADIKQHFGL